MHYLVRVSPRGVAHFFESFLPQLEQKMESPVVFAPQLGHVTLARVFGSLIESETVLNARWISLEAVSNAFSSSSAILENASLTSSRG